MRAAGLLPTAPLQSPGHQGAIALRKLLRDDSFIIAPGVHDLYSLRAIEQAGFHSAAISGAVLSHSLLGMPDIGLVTLTDSIEHCRRITRYARIPVTADADAGFGNALGVFETVRLFEEAGAAGINIEDQVVPRRWGSARAKEVVSIAEMVSKIASACAARRSADFVIIVRTDAFDCEPSEQVIARARAYEAAGADLLLPIAPRGKTDVARLVSALRIPITVNVATGLAPSPSSGNLSIKQLREVGVRRVSLPQLLPAAATHAMTQALRSLMDNSGEFPRQDAISLMQTSDLKAMMGDVQWIELEERLIAGDIPAAQVRAFESERPVSRSSSSVGTIKKGKRPIGKRD
jgi:2-methylisocitrate lyase-like PEP mutase family enzyme